jgi:hypothetical protein
MPGIFSYTAATNLAFATGGTAGLGADRGQAASLPPAQAAALNLSPAGEVGPVASQGESQAFWRVFS